MANLERHLSNSNGFIKLFSFRIASISISESNFNFGVPEELSTLAFNIGKQFTTCLRALIISCLLCFVSVNFKGLLYAGL